MNKKTNLVIFCMVVFISLFGIASTMDLRVSFEESISGKDGHTVHEFINSKLKDGPARQLVALCSHMNDEGHFGDRRAQMTRDAVRSMPKRWSTFFIKSDGTLYGEDERLVFIRHIWDSEKLIYSGKVPSPTRLIVQLDGLIDDIFGVAFGKPEAERPCFVKGGDLAVYNKENLIAIRIALLRRAPVREDFESDEDWVDAQRVHAAMPHLVYNTRIRLLVNADGGTCEFNTAFPTDQPS